MPVLVTGKAPEFKYLRTGLGRVKVGVKAAGSERLSITHP